MLTLFTYLPPVSISISNKTLEKFTNKPTMATPPKTLLDFFQQPPTKRLKSTIPTTKSISSISKPIENNINLQNLLTEPTWSNSLSTELTKPYFQTLTQFLTTELSNPNKPIYPPKHLIFNSLNKTPLTKLKAVILGQDPYHGPNQAMGLSFSVPDNVKIPSSLVNIFKELNTDLKCSISCNGNLEKWALQGVLLLNAVLTVREHEANSHAKKGWEEFTDAVIRTISKERSGVVFLLWGKYAQAKTGLIDERKHYVLKAAHPSGLSAHRGFFGCKHFSRTNEILEELGVGKIDWQL